MTSWRNWWRQSSDEAAKFMRTLRLFALYLNLRFLGDLQELFVNRLVYFSDQLFFIFYNSVNKGPWEFSEPTADAVKSQMWCFYGQRDSAWSLMDNLKREHKTDWLMFNGLHNSALWLTYTKWDRELFEKSWKLQLNFQPFHLWKRQREIWCQGQKRESSGVWCSVLPWLQDAVSSHQSNWWRARACI